VHITDPSFLIIRTFQEYLLSPRTLLIGHKNLMFQCSELFYDELLGPIGSGHGMTIDTEKASLGTDLGKSVGKATSPSSPVALSFVRDWLSLVNEYRARKLSFGKDRIIAFAGVARAFQHLGRLTYLAGVWKECSPLGLLWYVGAKPAVVARAHNNLPSGIVIPSTVEVQEHVVQPTPTWSWFSVPTYAFHQLNFLIEDEEASARRKSIRPLSFACFDDNFWANLVSFQFTSHPVNYFPDSGFSDFAGLRVTLFAKTLPVSFDWATDIVWQMRSIQSETANADDKDFDCSPIFSYHPDDILSDEKAPPNNSLLALVAEFQIVRTAGMYTVQRRLVGLVLIQGAERGTCMRVGVWKLKLKISGVKVTADNMVSVAQRWHKYSVISNKWTNETITLV
jgi:hypothetical protein